MATAAIVLFNIQFNVHAETLEVSEGETVTVSGKPIIHFMQKGSKIIGKDLEIIHWDSNSAIIAEGLNSAIELLGDNTKIKDLSLF